MEKHSWVNWRITIEGVVNDLKETVKIQATKIELLEETVKEQRDRLEQLKAEQQFPSRNSNFENPVVRLLVRLRGLPADTQVCRSEDAGTAVPANEAREEREIECICIDEEIGLIRESLATAEKRNVCGAERSETLDLKEETADKKSKSRGADPNRALVHGAIAKPPRTGHHTSVKNKKGAATQLSSTVIHQPERRVATMPNSGPGRKNSSGVERPKCTLCSRTFVTVHTLHAHMRTHTGDKPFKCNVCPKSFARSQSLIVHSRTHSGEKPFKCKGCPKSFNDKSNFVRHKRLHTGEKPFTCNFCNATFASWSNLMNHIRIHTGESHINV